MIIINARATIHVIKMINVKVKSIAVLVSSLQEKLIDMYSGVWKCKSICNVIMILIERAIINVLRMIDVSEKATAISISGLQEN